MLIEHPCVHAALQCSTRCTALLAGVMAPHAINRILIEEASLGMHWQTEDTMGQSCLLLTGKSIMEDESAT